LQCEVLANRVLVFGHAITFATGQIQFEA
jgi:hypothetical protein